MSTFILLLCSRFTVGISHHTKSDLADTLFGVLWGGNWKCIGVGLSNKYWRMKKLRVNEFVEMHAAGL